MSKGIVMPDYKNMFNKEFLSISLPAKIHDDKPLADTITYMIAGEQWIASKIV
jgi:hypothetical protein